jgi:hypothetical protein
MTIDASVDQRNKGKSPVRVNFLSSPNTSLHNYKTNHTANLADAGRVWVITLFITIEKGKNETNTHGEWTEGM